MHRILAVKDALLRRNISVDLCCLSCDQNLEMIEHLFLQCWFAKRLWRASHLGFNFDVEMPVSFGVWFEGWILMVPLKELIWDSVFTLWCIWWCVMMPYFIVLIGNRLMFSIMRA